MDQEPARFDFMIGEIERLAQTLEAGGLPLEQSIKMYEQGLELIQKCQELLGQSKDKIQQLEEKFGPDFDLLTDEIDLDNSDE